MAVNRVTTIAGAVLHAGVATVRATTVAAQVLHGGDAFIRVTSMGVQVLRSVADTAAVDGNATGSTISKNVSIISGVATAVIDASVTGVTISRDVSLALEGLAGEATAIDGNYIWEISFQTVPTTQYQEADYHSIFSCGDRNNNGLIVATAYGTLTSIAPASSTFDTNYAHSLGSGWSTGHNDNVTGGMGMQFSQGVPIAAFRCVGSSIIDDNVNTWKMMAGFNSAIVYTEPYAREFDYFTTRQTEQLTDGSDLWAGEMTTTARVPAEWEYYAFEAYPSPQNIEAERFAEEMEFKIYHSILDGGDRRASNGRPSKQVLFSMSSDWSYRNTPLDKFIDPADAWFDGSIYRNNSIHDASLQNAAMVGKSSGYGTPQDVVGSWFQFVFPRPIIHKQLVIQGRLPEEYDSGGDPTWYGIWHWEYSKNNGATWTSIGVPWKFCEDALYALAPETGAGETFNLAGDATLGSGATHWRMVLDQGPAFGGSQWAWEFVFNLIDSEELTSPLGIAFTDDVDGVLPVVTVASESPFTVRLTDGSDDVLTGTLTMIPNPLLSVAFSDDATDGLTALGSFYPRPVVQISLMVTGR